jgi:1-deoxy-D-xylulose-5-phosphate synthase
VQVKPAEGELPDAAVLGYGIMVEHARQAMAELEQQGYDIALYDARFAKPVDIELIEALIGQGVRIVTIEDHALAGGFGSSVLEACNERGLPTHGITRIGHPEKWVYHASRADQIREANLDPAGIAATIRQFIDSVEIQPLHRDTTSADVEAPRLAR